MHTHTIDLIRSLNKELDAATKRREEIDFLLGTGTLDGLSSLALSQERFEVCMSITSLECGLDTLEDELLVASGDE